MRASSKQLCKKFSRFENLTIVLSSTSSYTFTVGAPLLYSITVQSVEDSQQKAAMTSAEKADNVDTASAKSKLKSSVKKIITSQKADASVIRELKLLYTKRLLPIEKQYFFSKLHYPEILEAELSAKPTVLLVGQYSTGKTSFIKNLLGMDYPEIHIGPEVIRTLTCDSYYYSS